MNHVFLAFIDGIDFNVFFRGLLSALTMFVVLCGSTYLILATNIGVRQGMMIASAGFFGWLFLMGVMWTIYGKGWAGLPPTWDLVEIAQGELDLAETPEVQNLAGIDLGKTITATDPDEAQLAALAAARGQDLSDWRYLATSNSIRGEAQSSVDAYLVEEGAYALGEFLPLQFGAFSFGGKPLLVEDASQLDRFVHFFERTFAHPVHSQELIAVQVQGVTEQFVLAGDPPPVAQLDPEAEMVTVVMERNRGGPIPNVISGLRFTPFAFTVVNGIIFLALAASLHNRSRREDEAVAAA